MAAAVFFFPMFVRRQCKPFAQRTKPDFGGEQDAGDNHTGSRPYKESIYLYILSSEQLQISLSTTRIYMEQGYRNLNV